MEMPINGHDDSKQTVVQRMAHLPSVVHALIILTLAVLVGWLDMITGWEWSLFVFYALPISLAVSWGHRGTGIGVALLCTIIWWVVNEEANPYESTHSYVLAAVSRLFYFILAALIAARVKGRTEADAVKIQGLEELRQLESDIVSVSEHEQQRIGQDLHDGICQQLAAIGCSVRALADDLHEKSIPEADDAEYIEAALQRLNSETRSLARGIFPMHVGKTGLSSALTELAQTMSRMTGVPIDVAEWSEVEISDPDVSMHLYRIAQEAVSNALKHSGASAVDITVRAMGDLLELRIDDDGRGFGTGGDRPFDGMGLRTMRYRARAVGASIEILPRPEGGTSVCCTMKVKTQHEIRIPN